MQENGPAHPVHRAPEGYKANWEEPSWGTIKTSLSLQFTLKPNNALLKLPNQSTPHNGT